ncbi:MAG TPA: hypothetical protein VHE35_22985, partial [Kofleriaceae bacterium]|nr:hypothetical protein [Kofleriaceae bacterium]
AAPAPAPAPPSSAARPPIPPPPPAIVRSAAPAAAAVADLLAINARRAPLLVAGDTSDQEGLDVLFGDTP